MKNLSKMTLASALLVSALALSACGGGGGGSSGPTGPTFTQQADSVAQLLGSNGSGTYTVVKLSTQQGNYVVYQDPDGSYSAYNVGAYQQGMTLSQFQGASQYYTNLSYGYEPSYGGNIFTDPASGLVFEEGNQSSKDLEAVSAAVEQSANADVSSMLVSTYGLSQDRAADIASLAQSWKSISASRTMTTKDLSEFQSKVFGTDLSTISKAAAQAQSGSSASYDALIAKAANLNGISPEQTRAIMQGFIQQ